MTSGPGVPAFCHVLPPAGEKLAVRSLPAYIAPPPMNSHLWIAPLAGAYRNGHSTPTPAGIPTCGPGGGGEGNAEPPACTRPGTYTPSPGSSWKTLPYSADRSGVATS